MPAPLVGLPDLRGPHHLPAEQGVDQRGLAHPRLAQEQEGPPRLQQRPQPVQVLPGLRGGGQDFHPRGGGPRLRQVGLPRRTGVAAGGRGPLDRGPPDQVGLVQQHDRHGAALPRQGQEALHQARQEAPPPVQGEHQEHPVQVGRQHLRLRARPRRLAGQHPPPGQHPLDQPAVPLLAEGDEVAGDGEVGRQRGPVAEGPRHRRQPRPLPVRQAVQVPPLPDDPADPPPLRQAAGLRRPFRVPAPLLQAHWTPPGISRSWIRCSTCSAGKGGRLSGRAARVNSSTSLSSPATRLARR